MPRVIVEVQSKRIVFGNPVDLMRGVVIPTDEINGVFELIAIRAVVSRFTLVPVPSVILGL